MFATDAVDHPGAEAMGVRFVLFWKYGQSYRGRDMG